MASKAEAEPRSLDCALSCYAQSFDNGLVHASWAGEPQFSYRPGWLWLIGAADASGIAAWHRKQRVSAALAELDERHAGEAPLWLRWSHPSDNVDDMLASWNRYATWWRRAKPGPIDLVGVVDRGLHGAHVWHIHGYGFGNDLEFGLHAARAGRAGFYPFIKVRRLDVAAGPPFAPGAPMARTGRSGDAALSARSYLLRRVRGYVSAKQGSRYLRLRSA